MPTEDLIELLQKFPGCKVQFSVDVSRHGLDEDEAGRRAFTEEYLTFVHNKADEVTLCFSGYLNDEIE